MKTDLEKVDILVFGAHPDDVEWCVGGFILKMISLGHSVGLVDLTRGEMGSKGNVDIRTAEAMEAAKRLGVKFRHQLDMGDGRLFDTHENRCEIAKVIRLCKPELLLTANPNDRHPDHSAGSKIVKNGAFLARLQKLDLGVEWWAVNRIFYYFLHDQPEPDFITDITEWFPKKREALQAYKSQFYSGEFASGYKYVGTRDYPRDIETKGQLYGALIGVDYGEPFLCDRIPAVEDPFKDLK